MTPYIIVTGIVFALLTVAHVLRLFAEPHLVGEPWFMVVTLAAAGLAVAAWRVVRRAPTRG